MHPLRIQVPGYSMFPEAVAAAVAARDDTNVPRARTILLHADDSTTLKGQLERAGINPIAVTSDCTTLADLCVRNSASAVLLWHRLNRPDALEGVRLLNEARLPESPIIIALAPGDEAKKDFLARGSAFLFESAIVVDLGGRAVGEALSAAWTAVANRTSPDAVVRVLRQGRLSAALGTPTLTATQVLQLAEAPSRGTGRTYWTLSEGALTLMALGANDDAVRLAAAAKAERPDAVDAVVLLGTARAQAGNRDVPEELVRAVLLGFKPSEDELARIGAILVQLGALDALHALLEGWLDLSGKGTHGQYFLAAHYLASDGKHEEAGSCLALAVSAAPRRGDYLAALATHLEYERDWHKVGQLWDLAMSTGAVDKVRARIGMIRAAFHLRRVLESGQLLAELVKEYPRDPRVLELKRELGP